jgi:hypothetical protein
MGEDMLSTERKIEISIMKNNKGPAGGSVFLRFVPAQLKFTNYEEEGNA